MKKTPKTREVTVEDARKAVETLALYGRKRFTSEADPTPGMCIGMAVSACTGDVVDAAMEMLEDWNYHLAVAAIAAIQKNQGTFKRKGRILTIKLPKHWDRL
jgi:hypothetical protein